MTDTGRLRLRAALVVTAAQAVVAIAYLSLLVFALGFRLDLRAAALWLSVAIVSGAFGAALFGEWLRLRSRRTAIRAGLTGLLCVCLGAVATLLAAAIVSNMMASFGADAIPAAHDSALDRFDLSDPSTLLGLPVFVLSEVLVLSLFTAFLPHLAGIAAEVAVWRRAGRDLPPMHGPTRSRHDR